MIESMLVILMLGALVFVPFIIVEIIINLIVSAAFDKIVKRNILGEIKKNLLKLLKYRFLGFIFAAFVLGVLNQLLSKGKDIYHEWLVDMIRVYYDLYEILWSVVLVAILLSITVFCLKYLYSEKYSKVTRTVLGLTSIYIGICFALQGNSMFWAT